MTNQLLMTLQARDDLSREECDLIEGLATSVRSISTRTDFVVEGEYPKYSCLMLSGFSARYNLIGDGKRQISAIHIPGDFVDLHSLLLKPMDHSVTALTECSIALVAHERLRDLSISQPHLTRLLWLLTVVDGAIFRQSLVAAARLPAERQIARFFCEMHARQAVVGLSQGMEFNLPLTQTDLSDAMGLSLVHVNKCLQKMRREGLLSWKGSTVKLLNLAKMNDRAEFDPTYLNLVKRAR